jgi:hypothetical protein
MLASVITDAGQNPIVSLRMLPQVRFAFGIPSPTPLKTAYSYSLYFGLSCTFGSIFNNIVNPRFGSGGGTTMVMYY